MGLFQTTTLDGCRRVRDTDHILDLTSVEGLAGEIIEESSFEGFVIGVGGSSRQEHLPDPFSTTGIEFRRVNC